MKRLMTTALTLALMATTATAALAQERGGRERGGGPREDRGGRQEQRMERGGDRGDRGGGRGDWGGDRGQRQRPDAGGRPNYTPTQAAPTSPPAYTQPQAASQNRGDRDWNRGGERRDDNRNDGRNNGRPDGRNDNERRGDQNRDWNRNDYRWNDNDRRGDNRWGDDNRRWDNDRRGDQRFDRDYRRPSQMRDRDRGRGWYDERRWQRSYHAPRRFRAPAYRPPSGWYARNWGYGDFLPRGWFGSSYYLNWGTYGLGLPPIGTEWVRVGPDALLVDIWTGRVLSVYYGLFW